MKEFLYYTRSERRGLVVLLLLCIFIWVLPRLLPWRARADSDALAAFQAEVLAWQGDTAIRSSQPAEPEPDAAHDPMPFDPNTADRATLAAAGLSHRTISAWLSYTSKGGRFRDLEDLEQFRALSAEDLAAIRPYLRWPRRASAASSLGDNATQAAPEYFSFDPNDVTREELRRLGVGERVASAWLNFLASGARFRQAEEVRKVYGLSTEQWERLAPHMTFASPADQQPSPPATFAAWEEAETPRSYETVAIDINQASAEQWQSLYGIGPAFSRRIVQFRDKLGGFARIEQVAETYGLPDSTFQRIRGQLRLSPITRPLAINHLSKEDLADHPYLGWREAEALIRYRQQHGPFSNLDDLRKVYALDAGMIERLAPYLVFE